MEDFEILRLHFENKKEKQKLQVLDQAPAKWEETRRAAFEEKEKILPPQNIEPLEIQRKTAALTTHVLLLFRSAGLALHAD